jgi:phosphatidylglycerol:prolipoprotein diacylglycerol transferase
MRTKKALITQVLVTVLAVVFLIALYYLIRPSPEHPLNPVVFALGTIAVHWYGLLIALSFIPAIYTSVWMARNWGINPDHVYNLAILAAPLAVIFARIFYCLLNWGYYAQHPVEILYIWLGGLSLYGVIFGGVLACLIYAAVSKIGFLRVLDLGAPALLLGQAIGRWGNFFNQELFGYPTNLPWKMWVNPDAVQALQNQVRPFSPETRQWILGSQYFHPTFLYESIANVLFFGLLIWIARRKDLKPGIIVSLYLIVYSAYRFFEEWVRIEPASVGPFSWGQIGSLATILVGVMILFYIRRRKAPTMTAIAGGPAAVAVTPTSGVKAEVVVPSAIDSTTAEGPPFTPAMETKATEPATMASPVAETIAETKVPATIDAPTAEEPPSTPAMETKVTEAVEVTPVPAATSDSTSSAPPGPNKSGQSMLFQPESPAPDEGNTEPAKKDEP